LLQKIRLTIGRRSLLFPVPIFVFILIGRLLGKIDLVDRLVGDLQLDTSKALKELDWSPPFTVDQGIKSTVNFYLEGDKKHDTYF
jgi:nucleoside-diphosphate-sugar epimerase